MKQEWNERRDRSDRRNSTDRRIGRDRRTNGDRREINELRGENVSVDSERLTGKNQRSGTDRRTGRNRRAGADQRGGLDRRLFVGKTRKNTAKLILGVVVLAGIILSSIGWRWIFWINIPIWFVTIFKIGILRKAKKLNLSLNKER